VAILIKEHLQPLPGFGIELKSHFRNDLLLFGYNNSSFIRMLFLWFHEVTL